MTEVRLRLAIVTDGTPVSEDIWATGMCRVNTRLFMALFDHITLIAAGSLENTYSYKDIDKELRKKSFLLAFPRPLMRILKRFRFFPKLWDEEMVFQLMLPKLIRELHQRKTNWIFCPCGVNPSNLGRGVRLAKASGLPLAVYMVDDFLAGAVLSGNKEHLLIAKRDVPKWLAQVQKIFVISEGLRRRVKELYNLDSIVLPLPYDLPPKSSYLSPIYNQRQIIFVGSLSHFYLDGLKQIAVVLDKLNQEEQISVTFKILGSHPSLVKMLIGDFACIRCEVCEDMASFYKEINSSLLCFAPYSFDLKYKEMVSSSFPSKMLDYLSVGRFIVTYGPDYASSVEYFREKKLPTVICNENSSDLSKIIQIQLKEQKDYNQRYREVVQDYHSSRLIADQVISNLK